MNTFSITKGVLAMMLVLATGIFIGKGIFKDSGTHRMSDGTMMSNRVDMTSMMHDMNAALKGKTGDDFDQAFLREMIIHHEGAVDMARQVLNVSKRPELIQLAQEIITAQTKEIEMMKAWQLSWFK